MTNTNAHPRFAYFSMEIGFCADIPTYSGGLGVLAGDTIRAAADLRVPLVGVTLLHRKGYFRQSLDDAGNQTEGPRDWVVEDFLDPVEARASLIIEGREVHVRAWTRDCVGYGEYRVPVFFLDTDLPENHEAHRGLTHHLYGGDQRYRLCQEAVLGIGGVRMLRALGFNSLERFHMNEGHASLLGWALVDEQLRQAGRDAPTAEDIDTVRRQCVFTTHTPVPAGHDQFPPDIVERVLERRTVETLRKLGCVDGSLNMTYLALHLSHYVNGVAKRHGEISRRMFAPFAIDSITNGVHARTWICPPLQEVFDEHIRAWREDSFGLRHVLSIPNHEIWEAHAEAKRQLLAHVARVAKVEMDPDVFTIGFARRAAAYKRADMFFDDLGRLRRIYDNAGEFQVIYAGKAHPHDGPGKDVIRHIFQAKEQLKDKILVAYIPDYDMEVCQLMTSGVDVWLNTPEPPMEASGTSGMKAALNGVPSLSVLDGWWLEGWIEGKTGWSIGRMAGGAPEPADRQRDAAALYDKLEHVIIPFYYQERGRYVDMMRHCIALNGSYFNTQRMMAQYVLKAYFA